MPSNKYCGQASTLNVPLNGAPNAPTTIVSPTSIDVGSYVLKLAKLLNNCLLAVSNVAISGYAAYN